MTYSHSSRSVDTFRLETLMTIGSQVNSQGLTPQIVTVSRLNKAIRDLLESDFDTVWVAGEISNFMAASSGHWYFTLKDDLASVRGVMFRTRAIAAGFTPRAGDAVEVKCRPTLYEARGEFQLQVEQMRRAGQGNLFEAFVALKDRLQKEGLFEATNKRALNRRPRAIGVITSLSAAALQDVLTALNRRAPHIPIVIYPSMVQGADAPLQLRHALALACDRAEVDTLLLVRGGGSIEDLWAFNDEALARDIAASVIPVVTGVGHETDFTIADFVSDLRAPTPTAAAELVCDTRDALVARLTHAYQTIQRSHQRLIERLWQRIDRASAGLISPEQRLVHQSERVRALAARLVAASQKNLYATDVRLNVARRDLLSSRPDVTAKSASLLRSTQALKSSYHQRLTIRHNQLNSAQGKLHALSPENTLARGYAIVLDNAGVVIQSNTVVQPGQSLNVMVADGNFKVNVST